MNTRPDIAPVHSFLSSYNHKPSVGHMKAAIYALHYVHSTHDYGISFTSADTAPMHTYVHYPASSDVEAYEDAIPPAPGSSHKCTTYSDACWGSQIGNAVREGIMLPLFKFRSMSGGIVFRSGGPIAWLSERQDRTSLSSCESENRATAAAAKDTRSVRHVIAGLREHGYPITDDLKATVLYNDNEACAQWSHNMTMKRTRHMENRETSLREWVQEGSLAVRHVRGRVNPADIFTKEMKDGAHFRRLRDSFMTRSSAFSRGLPTHPSRSSPLSASRGSSCQPPSSPGLLEVLASCRELHHRRHFLHLSSAGRQYAQAAFLAFR